MPTQAEIDAGQDQASIDTAAAKGKQNNNNQAAKDTAAAKAKQNGGDGGTSDRMDQREAAAGLTLAGNDTTSGRGLLDPTFSQREAAAGLTGTTVGRDDFYTKRKTQKPIWSPLDGGEMQAGSPMDFEADVPAGGGSLSGVEIIFADQTEAFISTDTILENYDGENYWSVVFGVSAGAFTQAITLDSTQVLWDDVGTDQTVYRLRVKTLNDQVSPNAPTQISAYGQYREDILCVSGDPVVTLVKIS